jgi:hypothetical protein
MARIAYTGTRLDSYGNVEPGMDRGRDPKGRVPASLLEYADAHIWPHLFCLRRELEESQSFRGGTF